MSSSAKDAVAYVLKVVDETPGWRWERTKSSHYKIFPPKPHPIITVASSPGQGRATANMMAPLRKAGLKV